MLAGVVCLVAACHASVSGALAADPASIPPASIPVAPLAPVFADYGADDLSDEASPPAPS